MKDSWVTIQSRIPGRVRFRVPALKDNPFLKQSLEWALSRQLGVYSYSVSTVTGTILVRHRETVQTTELMANLTGVVIERSGLTVASAYWACGA